MINPYSRVVLFARGNHGPGNIGSGDGLVSGWEQKCQRFGDCLGYRFHWPGFVAFAQQHGWPEDGNGGDGEAADLVFHLTFQFEVEVIALAVGSDRRDKQELLYAGLGTEPGGIHRDIVIDFAVGGFVAFDLSVGGADGAKHSLATGDGFAVSSRVGEVEPDHFNFRVIDLHRLSDQHPDGLDVCVVFQLVQNVASDEAGSADEGDGLRVHKFNIEKRII